MLPYRRYQSRKGWIYIQESIHNHKLPICHTRTVLKDRTSSENPCSPNWRGHHPTVEKYRLNLKTILSVAVLQQSDGYTRYLVPLQDGIIINHPDDLLHGEDFTSCILDQRTVVTFDSTWATPRQSLPNTTTPDYQLPSGTWTQSNNWNPSLSICPVSSSSGSQT